jgi:hypothetical protein
MYSGVAVGSSIGHAIGGMFGGGSSAPAETQQAPAAPAQSMDNGLYQSNANSASYGETPACEVDVRNFRRCMDDNQGNMSICGWYLDQLVGFLSFFFLGVVGAEGKGVLALDECGANWFYRKRASRLLRSIEFSLQIRLCIDRYGLLAAGVMEKLKSCADRGGGYDEYFSSGLEASVGQI